MPGNAGVRWSNFWFISANPTKFRYEKGCFLRRTLRLISETGETPVLLRFFAEPLGVLGGGVEFHGGFEEFEFAFFGGDGAAIWWEVSDGLEHPTKQGVNGFSSRAERA